MDATPSFRLPRDAPRGVPEMPPKPVRIGPVRFVWGERTFVMGIVNVTPDSFSGDGLLSRGRGAGSSVPSAGPRTPVDAALELARRMAADGVDVLDIGGESSRPGHDTVSEEDELRRTVPVVRAVREALPQMPITIDTIKPAVAAAALDAGANAINDVWAVGPSDAMARLAAERRVPYVLMHNRDEARYRSVVAEVLADLARAVDRAVAAGCAWEDLIVDPGMGFGKTAEQNLVLLRNLDALLVLGRPVLLGASRKSTIGKVLNVTADDRVEGTVALTALAVRSGIDMVRVHDVLPNVRSARMADAVVRGDWREDPTAALPREADASPDTTNRSQEEGATS